MQLTDFVIESDRRRRPAPNFTPAQIELRQAARAITCPADGGKFRHLIDNALVCARCGTHAGNITGATLPIDA